MMNGYAITNAGWRGATSEEVLSEGETFVESIPLWLIDKSNSDELERQQAQRLSAMMGGADRAIQLLQDDFDIGVIEEEDLVRLREWKIYRSTLGKTPARPSWPDSLRLASREAKKRSKVLSDLCYRDEEFQLRGFER